MREVKTAPAGIDPTLITYNQGNNIVLIDKSKMSCENKKPSSKKRGLHLQKSPQTEPFKRRFKKENDKANLITLKPLTSILRNPAARSIRSAGDATRTRIILGKVTTFPTFTFKNREVIKTSHSKVLASENFNPEPAPSTCGQSSIDVTYETCSNAATKTKTVKFTSDHGY